MINGPHDTPDIASEEGLKEVYSVPYIVNFNFNRDAMRLDGPAFKFSRTNGGDGGGHPSNILTYPYPYRGLSTVGSILVLFGIGGAALSGFMYISVPCSVDFRKFDQAAINSVIKFKVISYDDSIKLLKKRLEYLEIASTKPIDVDDHMYSKYDSLEEYKVINSKLGKFLY